MSKKNVPTVDGDSLKVPREFLKLIYEEIALSFTGDHEVIAHEYTYLFEDREQLDSDLAELASKDRERRAVVAAIESDGMVPRLIAARWGWRAIADSGVGRLDRSSGEHWADFTRRADAAVLLRDAAAWLTSNGFEAPETELEAANASVSVAA